MVGLFVGALFGDGSANIHWQRCGWPPRRAARCACAEACDSRWQTRIAQIICRSLIRGHLHQGAGSDLRYSTRSLFS
jgi:nuclear transport factor 2 (NTF2) superfamily protein